MKVIMVPAKTGRHGNPYLSILMTALTERGVTIGGLPFFSALSKPSALHVHWLESLQWGHSASRYPFLAKWRTHNLINLARELNDLGKPVVWTVHNLKPHDFKNAAHVATYKNMCCEFLPLVSDVICMSSIVKEQAQKAFPELKGARFHIIRHPHYQDHFSSLEPALPPELDIDMLNQHPILGTFGKLRPYKAIPDTIRVMKGVKKSFTFVIAGSGPPAEISKIQQAIGTDTRFVLIPRSVTDEEILGMTRVSDLILFNFKSILNSGSVLAALSMECPVLAPSLGALPDLQSDLSAEWVKLFKGRLSAKSIEAALDALPQKQSLNLTLYAASQVALLHKSLYEQAQ